MGASGGENNYNNTDSNDTKNNNNSNFYSTYIYKVRNWVSSALHLSSPPQPWVPLSVVYVSYHCFGDV